MYCIAVLFGLAIDLCLWWVSVSLRTSPACSDTVCDQEAGHESAYVAIQPPFTKGFDQCELGRLRTDPWVLVLAESGLPVQLQQGAAGTSVVG